MSPSRKESPEQKKARARSVLRTLRKQYPAAKTALEHRSAYQLLVATILSAQCTDERVNIVTRELFRKYPTVADIASLDQAVLEVEIRSTGFFRMKAKSVIACSRNLIERFGGKVPQRLEDLVTLPGVGRKTANVVLGQAFGISSGVVVDTHVHRLARRLGFTAADTPEKIEEDLMKVFPRSEWIELGSVLILHGRACCKARKPDCPSCVVSDRCPSAKDFLPR
ncbi:MAG TPA: endonuclease III [Bacteroidota bacterium]|nr:endonuclease III [Bacteroidota bacterium]